jgi:predicted TPR repeat methyltransferase
VTADPAYVSEVFDELAETFEEKLVQHLNYRVPWTLVEMVSTSLRDTSQPLTVVDLGCGTGLCGRLLREQVLSQSPQGGSHRVVGVDLSAEMIRLSGERGGYDELAVQDIHDCLAACPPGSVDLVMCADTFIYVGDVGRAFQLCSAALRSKGLFAFSIETVDDPTHDFRLQRSGRYAQSREYIEELSRTYSLLIVEEKDISVRKEQTVPIPGKAFLLQRQ